VQGHFFAGESHDAFDDQLAVMPGQHEIASFWVGVPVSPFVHHDDVTGAEPWAHTIANDHGQPIRNPGRQQASNGQNRGR
jgi:hypothetical protein